MRVPGLDSGRDTKRMKGFAGLNNTADPMRGIPGSQGVAPKSWELLQQADNVNLTDNGGAVVRDGYTPFAAATRITPCVPPSSARETSASSGSAA